MGLEATPRMDAARSFAPFAAAAILAWISVPVGTTIDWTQYEVATLLLSLAVAMRLLRVPLLDRRLGGALPSLVFLAALDLLRNSAGGIGAGVSIVAMVPVFYIALHGAGRRELYAVLAGVAIFYLAPIVLVGPPAYPHTQYRAALLSVAVSTMIGLATRALVASVRDKAHEASRREQMLRLVGNAMRSLLTSPQARVDVCQAAMSIGEASAAVLYEPLAGSETMESSAIVGLEAERIEIPGDRSSAMRDAFRTGHAILVSEKAGEQVGKPRAVGGRGSSGLGALPAAAQRQRADRCAGRGLDRARTRGRPAGHGRRAAGARGGRGACARRHPQPPQRHCRAPTR